MTYVYALLDTDRTIRYVGQTNNLNKRRSQHWYTRLVPHGKQPQLRSWLASLEMSPEIHVLQEVNIGHRFAAERYWIELLSQVPSVKLLNEIHNGYSPSAETRSKMSVSQSGVPKLKLRGVSRPDNVRRRISESKTGKSGHKQSAETIVKRVEKVRGRKHSEETLDKLRGQKRSAEQCHNIREGTLPSRDISVTCNECGAGPFRGNAGLGTHKSKRHGYRGRRLR